MKSLVPRGGHMLIQATRIVPYLTPSEVQELAEAAGLVKGGKKNFLKGQRNYLLVQTLFQTGLRISECIQTTPKSIERYNGLPAIRVLGKGGKPRLVALPQNLADSLEAYAFRARIGLNDRFFNINRKRAWEIISKAATRAGFTKRVYPHLLRHSDAIERLRQTGNPKALQHHLGHSSMIMTMRYLSTLTEEDSLKIQQQVVFSD